MVDVSIYKRPYTSKSTVLVELTEAHFRKGKCGTSSETEATKEESLNEVSNNDMLKALVT